MKKLNKSYGKKPARKNTKSKIKLRRLARKKRLTKNHNSK